jgi:hypothetical protein
MAKQKINVYDPDASKRRIGVRDTETDEVLTSDRKKRPLKFFMKWGDVRYFGTFKKGKRIK